MNPALRVLVIGESLMDIVASASGTEEHIGGSPLNVAVGLARLTDQPHLLTARGADSRGETIADYLSRNRVELVDTELTERTSTALARLEVDGSARYEFDLHWPLVHAPAGEFEVTHAGSIGLFLEPGGRTVQEILTSQHPSSLITVDPNIRPSIVGPQETVLERFESVAAIADVVKMSDEDASWLYPGLSADEVLDRALRLGVRLAVVTRGGEGSTLASPTDRVNIPAREVALIDTIGAGDSYMSGLIHVIGRRGVNELREGMPLGQDELVDLGVFAAHVASITVSRRGANPPMLAEVQGEGNGEVGFERGKKVATIEQGRTDRGGVY
jgi:fructokinase